MHGQQCLANHGQQCLANPHGEPCTGRSETQHPDMSEIGCCLRCAERLKVMRESARLLIEDVPLVSDKSVETKFSLADYQHPVGKVGGLGTNDAEAGTSGTYDSGDDDDRLQSDEQARAWLQTAPVLVDAGRLAREVLQEFIDARRRMEVDKQAREDIASFGLPPLVPMV